MLKRLIVTVGVLALAGCAATVIQTQAPSSSVMASPRAQVPTGALVVVVSGKPAVQANGDWLAFLEEWRSSFTASAATAKLPLLFAKDETAIPANASILVRLTVNDFKYVSTGKRLLLGIMSGNAYMDVDAQYVELPSNKPFGAKKFNTSSSAWEGILSAVTPRQVETVSEMIVKEVVSTAPAKSAL
ncbi:MAG: hypothetical protein ACXWB8_03530 [Ramlibacter sp.]